MAYQSKAVLDPVGIKDRQDYRTDYRALARLDVIASLLSQILARMDAPAGLDLETKAGRKH